MVEFHLPELTEVPADFAEAFVEARLPAVLRGAVRDWPATHKWTPEYLQKTVGHRSVKRRLGKTLSEFSLGQFMEILGLPPDEAGELPYLANVFLHSQLPELAQDVRPLAWASPNWLSREPIASLLRQAWPDWLTWCEFFASQPATRFPTVHVDRHMTHAWCAQIYGSKTYWLWPRTQQLLSIPCLGKDLELLLPDRPQVVTLHAGDAIFIPGGWPHTAESVTTSLTTSGNFVSACNWNEFCTYFGQTDLRALVEQQA